jgi:hypothetical protein
MEAPLKHWCVSCDCELDHRTKKNTCDYCDNQVKGSWNRNRITKKDLEKVCVPRSYSDI